MKGFGKSYYFKFKQDKPYPFGNIPTWLQTVGDEDPIEGTFYGPLDCRSDCNEDYLTQGTPKTIGPICEGVSATSSASHKITFQNYINKTWIYHIEPSASNTLDKVNLSLPANCDSKIFTNNPYVTINSTTMEWTTDIPEDGLIYFTMDSDYPAGARNLTAVFIDNNNNNTVNLVGPDCSETIILPSIPGVEVIEGEDFHIGLRFDNVAIPYGAVVQSAEIAFVSVGKADDNNANFTIRLQNSSNPTVFSNTDHDISSRLLTTVTETQSWHPGTWEAGATYRIPELVYMVKQVVDANWIEGGSLAFIISGIESGSLLHNIASFDKNPNLAPTLEITYAAAVGVTAKRHVNNLLNSRTGPKGEGDSPIVDALYEGAMYFRGKGIKGADEKWGEVTHGKSRYGQQKNFVSVEPSHRDGEHYYPKNCKGGMSMIAACAGEEIKDIPPGTAVYQSPMVSNCQTNHIVLLTGGASTSNQSVTLIEYLILDDQVFFA